MDQSKLKKFSQRVGGDGCVIRYGYLAHRWGDFTRHKDWASAAKPVLSTLLKLAVADERLPSVDAPRKPLGWEFKPKYQANGLWNRDTVTIIPSLKMVIVSRAATPGKFEPGEEQGQDNQGLLLLMHAVTGR